MNNNRFVTQLTEQKVAILESKGLLKVVKCLDTLIDYYSQKEVEDAKIQKEPQ